MAKCTSQLFGLFKGPAIFILHNFSFLCNTVYLCLFMLNRGQFMYVYSQDLSNFTGTIFWGGGVCFLLAQMFASLFVQKGVKRTMWKGFPCCLEISQSRSRLFIKFKNPYEQYFPQSEDVYENREYMALPFIGWPSSE